MNKHKILFIFLITFPLLFPLTVNATTYYVDYRDGLDSNDGLSEGKPKKTVSMSLSGGDIVYLKRGDTYGADINLKNSGIERTYGTNASISASGLVMTVSGETFQTKGVTTRDKVYINGEGLFGIASVDSQTQITLSSATLHQPLTGIAYSISNPITLTIKTSWGTGPAKITGQISADNSENILVDGVITDGIEITGTTKHGFRAWNGIYGAFRHNIFVRNIYIHDSGGIVWYLNRQAGGIILENIKYGLVENCRVSWTGIKDEVRGDPGIGWYRSYYFTVSGNETHDSGDDGLNTSACIECYVQFNESYNHYSAGGYDGFQSFPCATSSCGEGFVPIDGRIIIRGNRFHDNGQNAILSAEEFLIYNNLFYYTNAMPTSRQQQNVVLSSYSRSQVYNNIFAFGANWGLRIKTEEPGKPAAYSPHYVKNNIFYENAANNSTGEEVEFNITNGGQLDYNIYVRKDKPVSSDKLVKWGASTYTLQQLRDNFGQEIHGKQCTAARCDWSWQTPYLFIDGTRSSSPDFHPAADNSPQVYAGTDIGLQFYMDKVKTSIPPNIGAYGLGTASSNFSSNPQPNPPFDLSIR